MFIESEPAVETRDRPKKPMEEDFQQERRADWGLKKGVSLFLTISL